MYQIRKYGRHWMVLDTREFNSEEWNEWGNDKYNGLVAVVLYRKGAEEIIRRLEKLEFANN